MARDCFATLWATHDSTLVQRYKAAGLVICGKSNTPEFGLATTTEPVLFGPTHNPWKHGYSSGGSSGGASALVAAGILPMAHASDGGGSIRIPASCCGLVGLKPTRGRIPLGPTQLEGWGGLSTTHAITKSVRDSAALLDISAGPELGSPYQVTEQTGSFLDCVSKPLAQQKIGLCLTTFNGADIDQEVAEITKANARQLENLGHFVELINVDLNTDNVRDAHGMIALSHLGAMLNAKQTELGRVITQEDIELGSWQNYQYAKEISAPEYARSRSDDSPTRTSYRYIVGKPRLPTHPHHGLPTTSTWSHRHDGRRPIDLHAIAPPNTGLHCTVQRHRPPSNQHTYGHVKKWLTCRKSIGGKG